MINTNVVDCYCCKYYKNINTIHANRYFFDKNSSLNVLYISYVIAFGHVKRDVRKSWRDARIRWQDVR